MRSPDITAPGKHLTRAIDKRIVFRREGSAVIAGPAHLPLSTGRRVFLLSPANASGIRARLLFSGKGQFDLARRLMDTGAPLGELFSFMSALYFRGKLAYAATFAHPPSGLPGVLIITPARGLLQPETITTLADLREMSSASVKHTNPVYREPLERDARGLLRRLSPDDRVILLGSVATLKYVEPLLAIFGEQLVFPCDFAGRGNMSRGSLLLRSSRECKELTYASVLHATRHKPKPAPVTALSRKGAARRRKTGA